MKDKSPEEIVDDLLEKWDRGFDERTNIRTLIFEAICKERSRPITLATEEDIKEFIWAHSDSDGMIDKKWSETFKETLEWVAKKAVEHNK